MYTQHLGTLLKMKILIKSGMRPVILHFLYVPRDAKPAGPQPTFWVAKFFLII